MINKPINIGKKGHHKPFPMKETAACAALLFGSTLGMPTAASAAARSAYTHTGALSGALQAATFTLKGTVVDQNGDTGTLELRQAKRTVTGTVKDKETGETLIGVTVQLKGTSTGTITDIDGKYTIDITGKDPILVFSYVGYTNEEIKVGDLGVINVQMTYGSEELQEVVVVGAGTQKKVSVTGSITSVKGIQLDMPTSSLTNALAGQMPGIIAMTTSGEPGSASDFYIRGISTFGGRATPLIMLDNVEISIGDLNNIPPETIESFSILKDASATAIYGSRGANGVMLVKTKSGGFNEKTQINITVENAIDIPANFPEFVDGATWMELYNEANENRNPGSPVRFSDEQIANTRNAVNPYVYPDVDWKKMLFRDFTMNQRANINVQGGGSKATYYMSIQATHDSGVLNTEKIHSWDNNLNIWGYNFQNNISYNLTPSTTLDLRMNAQIRNRTGGNYNNSDLFAKLKSVNPIAFPVSFPAREGDEHVLFGSQILTGSTFKENPYATMLNSFMEQRTNTINISLQATQGLDFITPGLSANILVNFKNWSMNSYARSIQPYLYAVDMDTYDPGTQAFELMRLGSSGTDYISQSDISKNGDETFFLQGILNYDRTFNKNNITGMLLYYNREFKNDVLPHRNQGFAGRFTYSYDYKYLAEVNFGYTGTERLAKGERFEFFPAISLGWVASSEDFFQPITDKVNHLKLRASYGLIGSDETGLQAGAPHFLYQDIVSLANSNYGYTTGEDMSYTLYGPYLQEYAVQNAVWEKVLKFNVGLDLKLFDSFDLTAEYFFDQRYAILLKREAWPESLGYYTAKPWSNKGRVNNQGVELSANYNKRINDNLTLELRGNFTYTENKIIDIDDPLYVYEWRNRNGLPMSYTMGYIAEGLFESQEEIDNSPRQDLGSTPLPGDIKYRDITGDGVIDDNDKVIISDYGNVPRIQYGFGASLRYKAWDFGVFFNGSALRTISSGLLSPFGNYDSHVFQFIADNRWNPADPDPNATYPRLGIQPEDTNNNAVTSTYWLRDGSFLRLKQAQIGYNFKHGRVYVSGNNLAHFAPFKQWDPELSWNSYPLQRIFNLGVQLTF